MYTPLRKEASGPLEPLRTLTLVSFCLFSSLFLTVIPGLGEREALRR